MVGGEPEGVTIRPDGRVVVFTANGPSGYVSVVDLASGEVVRRSDAGGSPWGLAVGRPR